MNIFQIIKEDFLNVKKNDPALESPFELFFNYPGLWAMFFYRIAHYIHIKKIKILPRLIASIAQLITNIDIHPASTIGRRVFIDHGSGVVIGATTIIGNDVIIYQQVTLGGVSTSKGKRHPTIEDNVVIGTGAKILGNITIGQNSKIGANSVVVKNIPKNSTATGIPARILSRKPNNNKLNHNELPDINKEIFEYLLHRIEILENSIKTHDTNHIDEEDQKLLKTYNEYIDSMK